MYLVSLSNGCEVSVLFPHMDFFEYYLNVFSGLTLMFMCKSYMPALNKERLCLPSGLFSRVK